MSSLLILFCAGMKYFPKSSPSPLQNTWCIVPKSRYSGKFTPVLMAPQLQLRKLYWTLHNTMQQPTTVSIMSRITHSRLSHSTSHAMTVLIP